MAQQQKLGNKNKEKEVFMLTGKAFWAQIRKPSKQAPDKYTMSLSLDDDMVKLVESKGVEVSTEETSGKGKKRGQYVGTENDRGNYVILKQSVYKKDGSLMDKPNVVDGKKNPVPESVLIGNGSLVNVLTSVYDWTSPTGEKGKSLNLGTIQLKTLVKYEQKSYTDIFPEEEFTYEGGNTTANTNDDLDFGNDDVPFE